MGYNRGNYLSLLCARHLVNAGDYAFTTIDYPGETMSTGALESMI